MNSAPLTLDLLQKGTKASVQGFEDEVVEEKMLEMGCLPGSILEVERIAPLGDPIIINVSGSNLALRKDEARHIRITVIH
jgi:ferrous iron transport protein A